MLKIDLAFDVELTLRDESYVLVMTLGASVAGGTCKFTTPIKHVLNLWRDFALVRKDVEANLENGCLIETCSTAHKCSKHVR